MYGEMAFHKTGKGIHTMVLVNTIGNILSIYTSMPSSIRRRADSVILTFVVEAASMLTVQ